MLKTGYSVTAARDAKRERRAERLDALRDALRVFRRELETERAAAVCGLAYAIETRADGNGFQVSRMLETGETETIVCGRYGFWLRSFARALNWSESDASERLERLVS
jgi:hypothetical protein